MEVFYRKEDGARKSFSKRKERAIGGYDIFLEGKGVAWVCYLGYFFIWGVGEWVKRAPVTDDLIGADKKISNWLRLHFWWGLRLQLGYVSSWGIMASSISYAFWSLWFFSLTGERNRSLNMCVLYWFGIFPEVLRTLVSGLPFWPPSLHFLFLSLAEGY